MTDRQAVKARRLDDVTCMHKFIMCPHEEGEIKNEVE